MPAMLTACSRPGKTLAIRTQIMHHQNMAGLRVSVEGDSSSIKEPEVSETERINGAHRPVREEWPAIS